MPAIRFTSAPNRLSVVNHYASPSALRKIWLKTTGYDFLVASLKGFICVAGTKHLKGGKLGKLLVRDVTNGTGDENSEWKTVPHNEFVYAMVLPGDEMPTCYAIFGDEGWPITTLDEFRNFPKCPPLK